MKVRIAKKMVRGKKTSTRRYRELVGCGSCKYGCKVHWCPDWMLIERFRRALNTLLRHHKRGKKKWNY